MEDQRLLLNFTRHDLKALFSRKGLFICLTKAALSLTMERLFSTLETNLVIHNREQNGLFFSFLCLVTISNYLIFFSVILWKEFFVAFREKPYNITVKILHLRVSYNLYYGLLGTPPPLVGLWGNFQNLEAKINYFVPRRPSVWQ